MALSTAFNTRDLEEICTLQSLTDSFLLLFRLIFLFTQASSIHMELHMHTHTHIPQPTS